MPVPIARLQEAQRPVKERVLEILQADPTQGFSVLDVYSAVAGGSAPGSDPATSRAFASLYLAVSSPEARAASLRPIQEALESLVAEGQVSKYPYQNEQYYAAVQR
jgi:hypothetical protein